MHFSPSSLVTASLLFSVLPLLPGASATSHNSSPQHHKLVMINRDPSANVEKRGNDGARITWYDITTNEVACGGWHSGSDHVVALNDKQWDNGAHCGKQIAITVNGKIVNAWIVDKCPGCPWAALDATQGLFQEWADRGAGELWGSWDFV